MTNMHGQWQIASATLNGAEQLSGEIQDLVLKIEQNQYELINQKEKKKLDDGEISFRLGGKMDIQSFGQDNKKLKAIYRLTPDTLTICYDLSNQSYPLGFESKVGDQHYLVTYKKQHNLELMKKVILIYGLIAGAIVAAMMFITMPLYENGMLNFDNGEVVGYTTMVVALSLVFFGIKSYRDNHSNGVVTFWKAIKVGLLITAIASVMYGVAWEVTYNTMATDFIQKMTDHYFAEMEADGATEAEMKKAREDWAGFSEMYKNPIIRFGVTLMEILPVGIIITLLSAGLLRRKEFLPPTEPA